MKKRLLSIILLGCMMLLLNACSNKEQQVDNQNSNSDNSGKTDIKTVAVGGVNVPLLEYSDTPTENDINSYGLFKDVNGGYIYKGGDSYLELIESGAAKEENVQGYLHNVVKFNDHYWRIINVNEDGSIRMVYFGTLGDIKENKNVIRNFMTDTICSYFSKEDGYGDHIGYTYQTLTIREVLNNKFLKESGVLPDNYSDYIKPFKQDITKYNIYFDDPEEHVWSDYEDYVGTLSISDINNAKYYHTTEIGYSFYSSYIESLIKFVKESVQLELFLSNIVESEAVRNGQSVILQIASIVGRSNGNFEVQTDYNSEYGYVIPVITLREDVKFVSGDGSISNPFVVE